MNELADSSGLTGAGVPRVAGVSGWWRAGLIFCLLLLALAAAAGVSMFEQLTSQVHFLQHQLAGQPHTKYRAVLLDAKQQPGLLVTFDPQDQAVELQRLNALREGPEESLQLWALARGQAAVSLGVLNGHATTLRLPVTDSVLSSVATLAISVENKGGANAGEAPSLPYLFSGDLVQKAH